MESQLKQSTNYFCGNTNGKVSTNDEQSAKNTKPTFGKKSCIFSGTVLSFYCILLWYIKFLIRGGLYESRQSQNLKGF